MFKKILYPTDFSEISKKVISALKKMAKAETAEVVLQHVIDSRNLDTVVHWSPAEYERTRKVIEDGAAEKAAETANALAKAGLAVKVVISEGIPSQEILKTAKTAGISAIIIGSHGKSNLREMLLGSVSEQVIKKSRKPVIVIKR
ncbi:MAG TPA: universal stress protein [Deltaproteobacteria bacterium]|jgi:nucleotide-binding universal stress UspA family protein|nr:universal stress protein [Deltaproteobacteria bacterium]